MIHVEFLKLRSVSLEALVIRYGIATKHGCECVRGRVSKSSLFELKAFRKLQPYHLAAISFVQLSAMRILLCLGLHVKFRV